MESINKPVLFKSAPDDITNRLLRNNQKKTVSRGKTLFIQGDSAANILSALREHPELAVAMLSCTFQHLHELVLQLEDMKALSGAKRLAAFLIGLSPVETGSCTYARPYDKVLIAARLGMKPESLAGLREAGVVVSRNHIAIAYVASLHDYVEEKSQRAGNMPAHNRLRSGPRLGQVHCEIRLKSRINLKYPPTLKLYRETFQECVQQGSPVSCLAYLGRKLVCGEFDIAGLARNSLSHRPG